MIVGPNVDPVAVKLGVDAVSKVLMIFHAKPPFPSSYAMYRHVSTCFCVFLRFNMKKAPEISPWSLPIFGELHPVAVR